MNLPQIQFETVCTQTFPISGIREIPHARASSASPVTFPRTWQNKFNNPCKQKRYASKRFPFRIDQNSYRCSIERPTERSKIRARSNVNKATRSNEKNKRGYVSTAPTTSYIQASMAVSCYFFQRHENTVLLFFDTFPRR